MPPSLVRRRPPWNDAAVLLALALSGCACVPHPRPNILLIVVDGLRSDHLGFAGYPRPTSPCLDILSNEGFAFTAVREARGPSGAGPSTGENRTAPSDSGAGQEASTWSALNPIRLSGILSQRGWATAGFFGSPTASSAAVREGRYDYVFTRRLSPSGILSAQELTDAARAWIRSVGTAPWFCLVVYSDLCESATSGGALQGPDEQARRDLAGRESLPRTARRHAVPDGPVGEYDDRLTRVDSHICDLLDALTSLRLTKNSLVVVVSGEPAETPNGSIPRGEGDMDRRPPAGSLILWSPGRIPRGRIVHLPIDASTVVPTVVELAGFPQPARARGASLVPILH